MEQRGFILIADITGYTAYLNDSELEHAQGTLTDLLELLIDHTRSPLIISRLEGEAYHALGRYEEAIAAFERARARNPKGVLPVAFLALTYADAGQLEEARAAAQEVLKLSPGFSAKGFVNALMAHKDRTRPERALATLLELGLPE